MRHQKNNSRKFHRTEEERKKLWKDLCTALILHGQIITFTARAKWFRPKFERLVTLCKRAKDNPKAAFYRCRKYLSEKVARKLIEDIVPKLQDRQGGYTAQYKLTSEFSQHDKSLVKIVS